MRYTVRQLGKLAGVTNRTLHYYDQIGLLQASEIGDNGYRYYEEDALLRLQQILFYRELDFSLEQIKDILSQPDFDLLKALEGHKRALLERGRRVQTLIETVERTILHLQGVIEMSKQDLYSGFDEEQQKQYEVQVRQRWGDAAMERTKPWSAYTPEQKNNILNELHDISAGVAANMEKGHESADVQYWIDRWYQAINTYFYECSLEIFEALGHGYTQDPAFTETYEKIRPGLAAFMEKSMTYYCQVRA
jgi:DNA-binding transcriptional MerR regulator